MCPLRSRLLLASAALALVGCSGGDPDAQGGRVSIRIQGAGGQTGGEGSCPGGPLEPLRLTADEMRALVLGRHETTLAHRPSWLPIDPDNEQGKRMVLEVSARGEARNVERCTWSVIELPVELKISLDEPALDLIVQHTITGWRPEAASVQFELPGRVAEQMGFAEARAKSDGKEVPSTFLLWFGADGPRGEISSIGCGSMVFPAGRRCVDGGSLEIPLSMALREALDGFAAVADLPVKLPDGTRTSLKLERRGEPQHLCSGHWPFPILPAMNLESAEVPARLSSADGRIDLAVNGTLRFGGNLPSGGAWAFAATLSLPAGRARAMPYFATIRDSEIAIIGFNITQSMSRPPNVFIQLGAQTATANGAKLSEPVTGGNRCLAEGMPPLGGTEGQL